MAVARINGEMISWALRRLGAELESLSTPKSNLSKLRSWVAGEAYPSEGDAIRLADKLGLAYPMLFMVTPPEDERFKVPDLRTKDGDYIKNPSLNLLDTIDLAKARQLWYKDEFLSSDTKPLPFIGKYGINASPSIIARDMRHALNADDSQGGAGDYGSFLKLLIAAAENQGILVMRSSVAGHATKRTLDVNEFRGFVLIDDFAPVIFINDNDAKAAQIFTFAHEIAHLWLGVDGISDRTPNDKDSSRNRIELACDAIAAEFLTPTPAFKSAWKAGRTLDENIKQVARVFQVSTLVVLRKARDLSLISAAVFVEKIGERYIAYKRLEESRRKSDESSKRKEGGNFWASFELRNGAKFNAAVVESIHRQRITYSEAGSLFAISAAAAGRYVGRKSEKL